MPTQVERSAVTQARLKATGRELFATVGFAAVTTGMLADHAEMSRGPLYHQFGDKLGLFRAVFADLENEISTHVLAATRNLPPQDPLGVMRAGMRAFLEVVSRPSVLRIAVIEAPVALGWQDWHDRGIDAGFPLTEHLLGEAIRRGQVTDQPTRPLAHVVLGVAIESAVYVSRSHEPRVAFVGMEQVIDRVIRSFGSDTG